MEKVWWKPLGVSGIGKKTPRQGPALANIHNRGGAESG